MIYKYCFLIISLAILAISSDTLAATPVDSQTQSEMNIESSTNTNKADAKLNEIYKKILKEYADDTAFIENLKKSQRAWIVFRDAQIKMKFPERDSQYYGSIFPLCYNQYLEDLTLARIQTLQEWLDGVEEGDACSGSTKIKY